MCYPDINFKEIRKMSTHNKKNPHEKEAREYAQEYVMATAAGIRIDDQGSISEGIRGLQRCWAWMILERDRDGLQDLVERLYQLSDALLIRWDAESWIHEPGGWGIRLLALAEAAVELLALDEKGAARQEAARIKQEATRIEGQKYAEKTLEYISGEIIATFSSIRDYLVDNGHIAGTNESQTCASHLKLLRDRKLVERIRHAQYELTRFGEKVAEELRRGAGFDQDKTTGSRTGDNIRKDSGTTDIGPVPGTRKTVGGGTEASPPTR